MFQVGQSLGDYAILQELGKGGFGQVYKVEHTITGRREAMKVLSAGNSDATEQIERFLREIRLQASLNHPNIALVHTAFWVNDDLALVCELLEGRSLQRLLDEGPVSQERAIGVIAQVLDALSYAHARGIVHRDISPGNIFLTEGGIVKIIDFGLAKAATDLRLTREGAPVGAAHYMSPEQIRGARDLDARTDVNSCGVVLYELLAGKKPFEGDDAFTIMKAHIEQAPPSPVAANPQISQELSAILLRALAKRPEERFQSADAFLQAIKNASMVPATASAPRSRRSLGRPVLIAACATLAILIGILVAAVVTRPGNAQSPSAKSFAVPAPPAAVTPDAEVPPREAAATPSVATKTARKAKTRQPSIPGKPISGAALVEPTEPESPAQPESKEQQAPDTATPANAAAEVKPRNPVVKVLKRMNPFQQKRSTSPNDEPKN